LEGLEAAGEERGILKDIQKGTQDKEKEEPVARAVRELQGSSACSVKSVEWSLSDGLLYFQGKIYVPVRGHSTSSDVSSNISLSPLYIPPHHR